MVEVVVNEIDLIVVKVEVRVDALGKAIEPKASPTTSATAATGIMDLFNCRTLFGFGNDIVLFLVRLQAPTLGPPPSGSVEWILAKGNLS